MVWVSVILGKDNTRIECIVNIKQSIIDNLKYHIECKYNCGNCLICKKVIDHIVIVVPLFEEFTFEVNRHIFDLIA